MGERRSSGLRILVLAQSSAFQPGPRETPVCVFGLTGRYRGGTKNVDCLGPPQGLGWETLVQREHLRKKVGVETKLTHLYFWSPAGYLGDVAHDVFG